MWESENTSPTTGQLKFAEIFNVPLLNETQVEIIYLPILELKAEKDQGK